MNKAKLSDSWSTPQWLFDKLNKEHGPFDIDLCATKENSKCNAHAIDYLNDIYTHELSGSFIEGYPLSELGGTAFMNPPYSNPLPFVEKAWEDSKHCKIVCLVKCDSSTRWWKVFYDDVSYQERPGARIQLLGKRIKFIPPKGWEGKISGPAFPSAVVIMDRRNLIDEVRYEDK
jgi:phage N-6-adenine-methyltransferase